MLPFSPPRHSSPAAELAAADLPAELARRRRVVLSSSPTIGRSAGCRPRMGRCGTPAATPGSCPCRTGWRCRTCSRASPTPTAAPPARTSRSSTSSPTRASTRSSRSPRPRISTTWSRSSTSWPSPAPSCVSSSSPSPTWRRGTRAVRAAPGSTPDAAAGHEGGAGFNAGLRYLEAVNGNVLPYPRFITDPFMISLDTFFGGQLHTLLTSTSSLVDPMFMMKHFMLSLDNFTSGRLHTLLTSAFSHIDVQHLFHNMVGLYFFGSSIARMFGPGYLSQLYITGSLVGSAFYLAEMIFLAPRKEVFGGWKTPCLGASAAVNATILLEIFLHPTNLLYLHFFIPVPVALVGIGLIGADLWRVKKVWRVCNHESHC